MRARPKGIGWIIGLLLFSCFAVVAYWTLFFTTGDVHARRDPVYIAFESAFPLADGWMALCALASAIGLWRQKDWGFLFGLLAGSSSIFLGLMDVLFNLNEGNYALGGAEMAIEVAINLATLGLGIVVIVYLWRNRTRLGAIT
jgi:uncharacterized membrane protein (DUF2068 family)